MSNMTIIATYKNQEVAEQVIDILTSHDHDRQDMGLAVNPKTDEALLAVTVHKDNLDDTMYKMRDNDPNTIVARQTGWRQGDEFTDLHPNAERFTAVELKNKK